MQLYLTILLQAVFHLSFPGFQTLNLFLLLAPFFLFPWACDQRVFATHLKWIAQNILHCNPPVQ